jgi:hypothetical protein
MRPPCILAEGPDLRELDVFESAALWLPDRTQRNIERLCMSSSPLLTITESHGFRALVAAIISVIGVIRMLGCGLRNLVCCKLQLAEPDAGPTLWARLRHATNACACKVPVLWFDTSGGRDGPVFRCLRLRPSLVLCNHSYCPVRWLARQLSAACRGRSGFRT